MHYTVDINCTKIVEHLPAREGDRLYYDVYYETGSFMRIFNPVAVFFSAIEAPEPSKPYQTTKTGR